MGDIPMITIVERHGHLLTLDHRRLYALRAALPSDAKVPMRLLLSEWAVERVLPSDTQYYHAVRVERSAPSCGLDQCKDQYSIAWKDCHHKPSLEVLKVACHHKPSLEV